VTISSTSSSEIVDLELCEQSAYPVSVVRRDARQAGDDISMLDTHMKAIVAQGPK